MLGAAFLLAMLAGAASQAATYYVRNGGDDYADGTSHDTAWESLDKAKDHGFAPGDRLLLHEGDHWVGQLIVNWSGTPTQQAVVGSYFLNNGEPTRGFRSSRPTIDGDDLIPQQYDGLVRIRGDRVRVENLNVVNSEGRAIQFENAQLGEVAYCLTVNSYKSGIKFVNSPNALALGNRVELAGVASPEDDEVWGGAIELVASDDGRIVGNTVLRVYGEGINANHGSRNALIEGNLIFAARAVGIYLDAAPDATVRRNIVFGTADPEFWRANGAVGAGIALNNETYHYEMANGALLPDVQSQRAKIHGNLVAYTISGLGFWGQFDSTSFDDVIVFNNTFVDNNIQLTLRQKPKPGSVFLNNVLLALTPDTRDEDGGDTGGMAARNNYFSRGDPGGGLSHPSNVYQGLTLAKMSGWRSISEPNELSWRDFSPRPGSSSIGTGTADPLTLSQADDSFGLDFNALPYNVPVDMGALRYTETPANRPKRPTGISGTPH